MVIYTVNGFGIVNKVELDPFLEFSCFFHDPADVCNLVSGSFAFSKTSLNIWKFTVPILLKPGLENFEHYFTSLWDECSCVVVWTFFGIAFLRDWNENCGQSCGHCWVFQICWHIECSTFTASSFRIWKSATGIPSPPLALFIVMLPKVHLALIRSRYPYESSCQAVSPWMALQTQHLTLVLFDHVNLLDKSPPRNSLFCRNKAKKEMLLGAFRGRAWKYSRTTKMKFWPSINQKGHFPIVIFIITDEECLLTLQVYLMDVWNRIKSEQLRNLPHLFTVYDEEKIEWVGTYRQSWYHLHHAKWSTNADLFLNPDKTATQNSSVQHFWFIYCFKKHFFACYLSEPEITFPHPKQWGRWTMLFKCWLLS